MKKILLLGYLKKNLGDDLFVSMLLNRYKDVEFVTKNSSLEFFEPFKLYKNYIKIVSSEPMLEYDLKEFSGCIYIGGSLFREGINSLEYQKKMTKFINKCKLEGIPFYYISSNFGPYSTEVFYQECLKKIKMVDGITFRDKYSYNKFKHLSNVNYSPDLVFSLDIKPRRKIKNSIGISVIDLSLNMRSESISKCDAEYSIMLKKNIINFINDNKKVYLFSFCEPEGDLKAIKRVIDMLPELYKSKVTIVNYNGKNGNLYSFIQKYSMMEKMICTRFHSLVLSLLFKQELVVLSYSSKLDNFLEDIDDRFKKISIDSNLNEIKIDYRWFNKISNDNLNKLTSNAFNQLNQVEANLLPKKRNKKLKIKNLSIKRRVKRKYNFLIKKNKKISRDDIMYNYDFSFIVPVYNNAKYIDDCIKSILKQNYDLTKIQVILINDGSTDNSLKKCKKYVDKYSNIILIDQSNQGVSIARNNGIKNAKGKYILFLDSDDFVSKNLCKEIFEFFEENYNKIDILTFPLVNFRNNNYTTHFRYASLYSQENCIYDINKNPEVIQTTINVCVKNLFQDNLLFDESMSFAEDEKFVTTIIKQKDRIGYCSKCSYYYRKNNTSCTKKYYIDDKQFYSYTGYYKELLNQFPRSKYVKNLFLNTLKWRLDEDKLFPADIDKDNFSEYMEIIKNLLKYISISDILSLCFLRNALKLAILELKDVDFKLIKKNNRLILKYNSEEYDFDSTITIFIKKLDYNKYPILEGNIDSNYIHKNSLKKLDLFMQVEKNYLFKKSHLNKVFDYKFKICFEKKKSIDFSKLFKKLKIKVQRKSYKINYVVVVEDSKLIVNKMPLNQKIKKIYNRFIRS